MTVFILSRKTYDYYEYTDNYGVFSSFDNAFNHAKSLYNNYQVVHSDETDLYNKLSDAETSFWYIEEYILDKGDEEL